MLDDFSSQKPASMVRWTARWYSLPVNNPDTTQRHWIPLVERACLYQDFDTMVGVRYRDAVMPVALPQPAHQPQRQWWEKPVQKNLFVPMYTGPMQRLMPPIVPGAKVFFQASRASRPQKFRTSRESLSGAVHLDWPGHRGYLKSYEDQTRPRVMRQVIDRLFSDCETREIAKHRYKHDSIHRGDVSEQT